MTATPATSRATRRTLVIWNPNAGSKAGLPTNRTSEDELRGTLAAHGLGDSIVSCPDRDASVEAVRAAVRDGYELVVAAGGDGTASSVAAELLDRPVALGLLPLGSAMNIGRSLGIPRELDAAVRTLVDGVPKRMDVGLAHGRVFFESGSVGLSAALFREAQRFDEGDFGSILATIKVALRHRPARMVIELDERLIRTRALMVGVANGPYTGMGLTIAPDARLDDGRFDVRVFSRFSRWELLRHLGSIIAGRHRYEPRISTYRSRRVRIESASPLPCRADSYDLGSTPVEFITRPGALTVIVPRNDASDLAPAS